MIETRSVERHREQKKWLQGANLDALKKIHESQWLQAEIGPANLDTYKTKRGNMLQNVLFPL